MAIEHRMDGAFGGDPDIAIEPPYQQFADLARTPVRLLAFRRTIRPSICSGS
jgi:hypothetical protein